MAKLDMEKCQPTFTTTICCNNTSASNRCRQTSAIIDHNNDQQLQRQHRRHVGPMVQSPILFHLPITLLLLFIFGLMAQHRNADAFLLAHRKMLIPYASSRLGGHKMAASSLSTTDAEKLLMKREEPQNGMNIDGTEMPPVPAHLVAFLLVPKRNAITVGSGGYKMSSDEAHAEHDGLPAADDAEHVVPREEDQLLDVNNDDDEQQQQQLWFYGSDVGTQKPMVDEQQEANDDNDDVGTDTDDSSQMINMDKRMHHLSILRKIGSPGANIPVSRLFGPSRQRELKRRAWMIQY